MPDTHPEHVARQTEDARPPSPYEPPGIAWEEDWDVRANLASACAKQNGSTSDCNMDPAS